MREIVFKGKRLDNGEWIIGNLVVTEDAEEGWEAIIIPTFDSNMFTKGGAKGDLGFENWNRVDENTICQYTGLTDKNGKKIWENDVVNCPLEECCGKVIWNENEALFAFTVLCEDGMFEEEYLYDFENYIEVIGNVFDNPELLEGGAE